MDDPREEALEGIRSVLREEPMDADWMTIPLVMEAATAKYIDGRFYDLGKENFEPNQMSLDEIKSASLRLQTWHKEGVFVIAVGNYSTFKKRKGGE